MPIRPIIIIVIIVIVIVVVVVIIIIIIIINIWTIIIYIGQLQGTQEIRFVDNEYGII